MTNSRFTVELVRDAEKGLKRLRPWTSQVVRHLARLEDDPLAGHALSGTLRGTRSLAFNLQSGGAYRGVYKVLDTEAVCIVLIVGAHENIYERAERRYRAWLTRIATNE